MTVPTTTNKVVYAGDGVTTLWPFSFPVLQTTDLQVYVTDTLGNITLLSSNYSVDLSSSRVTYPLTGSPLAVNMKLTLRRVVALTQITDWKNQGPFNAEVLETDEDKLMMAIQQLNESVARCVQYGVDQTPSDTTTATVIAAINAAVAALANVQAMTYLTPTANTVNDAKVAVAAGKYMKADGTGVVTYAGGQSPAFAVVSANSRIDLLCLDDAGTLSIVQGVQAASPVPALYPALKMVIAEVTITETATVFVSSGDIKDVRPVFQGSFQQSYVDALLWKAPVKAATTAALAANTYANGVNGYGATLTANANGALAAQDGITLSAGDRLLVKNEAAGANNGIYVVTQAGTGGTPYILTRALDSSVPAALASGLRVYVQQGTLNTGVVFMQTTTGTITIGSTSLAFSSAITVLDGKFEQTWPGFRNRIVNSDLVFDQRNNGTAVTVNSAATTYGADNWAGTGQPADGVFTIQRLAATPPTGFQYYLQAKVTTADASIGAAQTYLLRTAVEGYNLADLLWGTANAKPVTLSFWVRSSIAGVFSGCFYQSAGALNSYVFNYTINNANTWEQKTVTIPGPTSGTFDSTNGIAVKVTWDLGSGSSSESTAGSWQAGNFFRTSSGTKLISTLNATLDITGVQLEAGSTATPFEFRPYQIGLAMCMRYFQVVGGVAAAARLFTNGFFLSTTQGYFDWRFVIPMRAAPTITANNPTHFSVFTAAGVANALTALAAESVTYDSAHLLCTAGTASMAAGNSSMLVVTNTDATLFASADL